MIPWGMRRFTSYGPVDPSFHFAVKRRDLVGKCLSQLVGAPGEGGQFFTVWAPRQSGKSWLARRVAQKLRGRYGERFAIGILDMQGVVRDDDPEQVFLRAAPDLFRAGFSMEEIGRA